MWPSKHIKTSRKRKFSNKGEMEQEQGLKKWDNDREEKKEKRKKRNFQKYVCTHKKKRATARNIMRLSHKERWNNLCKSVTNLHEPAAPQNFWDLTRNGEIKENVRLEKFTKQHFSRPTVPQEDRRSHTSNFHQ